MRRLRGCFALSCSIALVAGTAPIQAQFGRAPRVRPGPGPLGSADVQLGVKQIASAGDMNGDGLDDVIIGMCPSAPLLPANGEVRVRLGQLSGLSSRSIWRLWGDQPEARLGEAVAASGDVNGDGLADALIGAPGRTAGARGEGRAYLYLGSELGLEAEPAWTADGGQCGAELGSALAFAGDVNGDGFDDALIAAPSFDAGEEDEGRVFLYLGSASGITASPAWIAEGNQIGARFGASVSSAGDVDGDGFDDVLIGAPGFDAGAPDTGRVYLYSGSPLGLTLAAAWITDGTQPGEAFGWSVGSGDLNGDGYDDAIVGAPRHDGQVPDAGAAWAYFGGATGLSSAPAWMAEGDQEGAGFGWSVCGGGEVDGDAATELIVGAPGEDSLQVDGGRVFLFRGSPSGPEATDGWRTQGDHRGLRLGASVAWATDIDGDGRSDLLAGLLPLEATASPGLRVYYGAGMTLPAQDWILEGDGTAVLSQFGDSLANAGDVDGDGHDDLLVGDPLFGENRGRVQLFRGSAHGPEDQASWTLESQGLAGLGYSVSDAGDVNADGFADIVIGAPYFHDRGAVFVFHGAPGGLAAQPDWIVLGDPHSGWFGEALGQSVSGAGDVNGDGYDDIIASGPNYEGGGRVLVFYGGAAGLSADADWVIAPDPRPALGFGNCVSRAGDVNGDGYDDVIVADTAFEAPDHFPIGRVLVIMGSPAGLSSVPAWSQEGAPPSGFFGDRVAAAGDVDGDGYDDVLVASRFFSNPEDEEGQVLLYLGSAAGLGTDAAWGVEGNLQDIAYGTSVARAGDVNGDGYDDVIVGACGLWGPLGLVDLYLGSPSGLGTSPARTITHSPSQGFGTVVASAGDQDGDGLCDWMVSAPGERRVFIQLGSQQGASQ